MNKILLILPLVASSAFAQVFTGGHGDVAVEYLGGGELELAFHLGEDGEEYFFNGIVQPTSPDGVEFEADELIVNVPSSTYNGSEWILPQTNPGTNIDTIPFLGLGTEELDANDWSGLLDISLISVTSPSGSGTFSVLVDDGFGGLTDLLVGNDSTISTNALSVAAGTHGHYNWVFSEAGTWQVELAASGTHTADGFVQGDPSTYTFNVVPEPSTYALLAGAAGLLFVIARRRRA